ncbi:NAD(P)-binding protein [Exidia glandulosa HHB12029]|uniref:NAD(P)-binding protein n=1 Tax=Exidia glandulosa HHB12029 TaxID=1314781 RepID=A0A165J3P4_EXIGL|nr:NAD(P)-binding protein [Exidia glandulosa HHB12029]
MPQSFGFSTTSEEVVNAFADRVKGRIFLVTGPTPNGIGDYTLRALATAHPSTLLLLGRNPAKYTPVVDAVHAIDPNITVRVYGADLSSIASVREGAKAILSENERIDVLINSAGVMGLPLEYSVDGVEGHFATNHLGHFLLTNLLLPALKKSDEPRVVNVSSAGHRTGTGDYSDYNFRSREYTWELGYGQSKLANIHFSQALAKRGITSLAVHPGVIWGTSLSPTLSQDVLDELRDRLNSFNVKSKTPTQGASTSLVAALDPKGKEYNGSYMADCQVSPPLSDGVNKEGASEELWKLSEKLVGQEFAF